MIALPVDKRRFLLVVHYPIFGGPHNHAQRLCTPLALRGWETLVLLPSEPGNAAARLSDEGIEVVQIPLHRLRARRDPRLAFAFCRAFPAEVARIRRVIRERRVALLVVGGLVNPHSAIAARLEHIPVVWKIVDSRSPRVLRRVLMPLVDRLADSVMYDGQALVQLHCGLKPPKVPSFVYFPPVDTQRFAPSAERRAQGRARLGIPADAPVIGMVANLNPQKGIEFFIRAASRIHKQRPDAWFVSVGARYETHKKYYEQLQAELGASALPGDRFIFAGEKFDTENYYPIMDVKLITSVPASEGTTTTAMEAMACGVPVVATNVGAVAEVVESGETGFVVPPLDDRALAEATMRLIRDPSLRERMGAQGRRRAVERFDVEICADHQVEIFEAAIRHHRNGRVAVAT